MRPLYIAIDGTIATGKTTLAKGIASTDRRFTPILEDFKTHPFLKKFYRDPRSHSLETELCFALIHYHSLKNLPAEQCFVGDFYFPKDYVYAKLTMAKPDQKLFTILYQSLKKRLKAPDLIIRLTAPADVLLERIRHRGRRMEASISSDYLAKIASAEAQTYKGTKVLKIDSSVVDFRLPRLVREVILPKMHRLL